MVKTTLYSRSQPLKKVILSNQFLQYNFQKSKNGHRDHWVRFAKVPLENGESSHQDSLS